MEEERTSLRLLGGGSHREDRGKAGEGDDLQRGWQLMQQQASYLKELG